MFGPMRLRARMTLWYTLLTFVMVSAFSVTLYMLTGSVLEAILKKDVQLQLEQITAQIESEHGMLTFENEVPLSKNTMYFITEEDGSELASYGDDIALWDSVPILPDTFQVVHQGTEGWLLLDSGILTVDHFRIRVRVAGSMATNDRVLSAMRLIFFLTLPGMGLASVWGGLLISRRSLLPIRQIIQSANRIAQGDLSARIPPAPARDELGEMTETLNQMLQSVEEAFLREKRFSSDASHELRTPVTVIRAYAETLRADANLTLGHASELNTILAECERMQKIIAQLLTITRGEEGRYSLCLEEVDLRIIAGGVAETLADSLSERQVTLSLAVPQGMTLRADQSLMTELLLNLTENAIKYSRPGGRVEISGRADPDAVELQVRDDGIGIPPEALPHIFERFYRVDSARDRSGTGLGLSIVAWIVRVHGGSIRTESYPGEGSVFTLRFPISITG